MTRDHRDLVIGALVDVEGELLDRVVGLTRERDSYRELAHASIHQSHELTQQLDRLRAQHRHLLDAYRHLRAQTRGDVAA